MWDVPKLTVFQGDVPFRVLADHAPQASETGTITLFSQCPVMAVGMSKPLTPGHLGSQKVQGS